MLGRRRSRNLRVLAQDRPLQLLQVRPAPRRAPRPAWCGVVRLERVRLPARAVKREHELPAEPFAERLLTDQSVELRNEGRVAPKGKIGVDAVLERLEAKLGEVRRRGAHRFAGQVGERLSRHSASASRSSPAASLGSLDARLFDECAETVDVELTRPTRRR